MSILPYEDEVICVLLDTYLWREFKASLAVRDIARDMVTRSWIAAPLAMADRSFLLASARIGLAPLANSLDGWITSRLRRKA